MSAIDEKMEITTKTKKRVRPKTTNIRRDFKNKVSKVKKSLKTIVIFSWKLHCYRKDQPF